MDKLFDLPVMGQVDTTPESDPTTGNDDSMANMDDSEMTPGKRTKKRNFHYRIFNKFKLFIYQLKQYAKTFQPNLSQSIIV